MLQLTKDLIACGVESGKIRSNYKLLGHRQVIINMIYQQLCD
jgi:hypothetical protein